MTDMTRRASLALVVCVDARGLGLGAEFANRSSTFYIDTTIAQ